MSLPVSVFMSKITWCQRSLLSSSGAKEERTRQMESINYAFKPHESCWPGKLSPDEDFIVIQIQRSGGRIGMPHREKNIAHEFQKYLTLQQSKTYSCCKQHHP